MAKKKAEQRAENSSELADRVASIGARNRRKTKAAPPEAPQKAEIVQLPFWPEPARAIPNDLARSALFCVQNRRQKRPFMKNAAIAAFGDTEILYTGEQLRQDDEDVFLQIQHLARARATDKAIVFRPTEMIVALRWPKKGTSYTRLRDCILRLASNTVEISCRLGVFGGSLIRKFAYKPDHHPPAEMAAEAPKELGRKLSAGYWAVWLEPEITQLFQPANYTLLDWEQRVGLSPLAKWLHSYYKGHADPFPVKVQTLHEKTGSDTKQLFHFRPQLKKALEQLVKVDFLRSWKIDDTDKVWVKRAGQ